VAFAGDSSDAVLVWPRTIRLLHWGLAGCVIASFVTHEGGGRVHEWTGYGALLIALVRCLIGLRKSQGHLVTQSDDVTAFSNFVRGPRATWQYLQTVLARREPRFVGHNPLGGWMIVLLLADVILTGFTGWLYTTDRFWGYAWLGNLHNLLGHAFVPLVALHLAGVAYTSWRHRENLPAAMLHGKKRKL
jgi:cytochrome b